MTTYCITRVYVCMVVKKNVVVHFILLASSQKKKKKKLVHAAHILLWHSLNWIKLYVRNCKKYKCQGMSKFLDDPKTPSDPRRLNISVACHVIQHYQKQWMCLITICLDYKSSVIWRVFFFFFLAWKEFSSVIIACWISVQSAGDRPYSVWWAGFVLPLTY